MDPFEEASKTDISDDKHSNGEEPRIKDVLGNLSKTVSRKRASDLLHSMAASKDILFWTPRGQLLRNQQIIPVTNISELVEYRIYPCIMRTFFSPKVGFKYEMRIIHGILCLDSLA